MDMIKRLTQGRHCTWWAEESVEPPSVPKQQILRGFPAQGIPFPKEEDIPRCDVCPHPKPIKRGPLPGWFSYGFYRRKAPCPYPDSQKEARKQQKVDKDYIGLEAMRVAQTRKKAKEKDARKRDEKDEFVRHDGHFTLPERKRVVSFAKQYQRHPQSLKQSDKMIDYGADNDMKMLAVPTCGINCYQVRQNVYKAVDELMSKQPEVVRIRPRVRPTEMLELEKLGPRPGKEDTSASTQMGYHVEKLKPSQTAVAVTSEEQKVEASTQTQSPPSAVAEAASLPAARPACQFGIVPHQPAAAMPSAASQLMEVPAALLAIHGLGATTGTGLRNGTQHKLTNLLFPQPRVATTVPEAEATTSKDKTVERIERPRYPLALDKRNMSALDESSSSLECREVMHNVRERQREKHWEREKVNSAILYQDLASKAKATRYDQGMEIPGRGTVDLLMERGEGISSQQTGEEMAREKAHVTHESDGQEAKTTLNSMLDRLNLEGEASRTREEAHCLQDTRASGGQEFRKSAEERRNITDSEGDQKLPFSSRSTSPTELEYMKAAIHRHNFYPRLISSFIEQHAAGAPPETLAKLEQFRWRVMQSWNPNSSVECDAKIRKYQEILTKFELELEKPFQEAMDYSFRLENMFISLLHGQKRKHDCGDKVEEAEQEEERNPMIS